MEKSQESSICRGKIVALEGPPDIVSAQLRLLPVSPQILILPSIQHYVSDLDDKPPSSIKRMIYTIHKAAKARHDAAMTFLRESAADQKRVVFLNGGTVGARFLCLSTITNQDPQGDFKKAEVLFDKLVSNGVAGLLSNEQSDDKDKRVFTGEVERPQHCAEPSGTGSGMGASGVTGVEPLFLDGIPESMEGRIMRAMRAAEALDKRTASLQLPDHDADLPATWFNNSKTWSKRSLGLAPTELGGGEDAPASPTSTSNIMDENRRLPCSISSNRSLFTSVEDLLAVKLQAAATICERPLETNIPAASLSWVDEACDVQRNPSLPASDPGNLGSSTGVCLTCKDLPSTETLSQPESTELLRPKSLDLGKGGNSSQHTPTTPKPPRRKRPPMLKLDTGNSTRSFGNITTRSAPSDVRESQWISNLSKVSEPSSTSVGPLQYQKGPRYPARYVDKATDTAGLDKTDEREGDVTEKQQFEKVLPLLENLVIQLLSDTTDPLFDRLFQTFRNDANMTSTADTIPVSPNGNVILSAEATDNTNGLKSSPMTARTDNSDPFFLQGIQGQMLMHAAYGQPAGGRLPTPPYDLYAPATPRPGPDQRFQTVPVRRQTSVSVQTTLRLMLSSYIPSEVWTQYPSAPIHPETGALWKPVLWGTKANRVVKPKHTWQAGKNLDLILAIGAERSIKTGYTSNIIRQLEKLGCSSAGVSRTGRVLLKNLHAQVMQAYTNRRLLDQTQESPFTDPPTLASLILPHLEKYVSSHPDVRFLIVEFVTEHLPTVLALRRLIGSDILKVASIVGSDNPDLKLSSHSGSQAEKCAYTELRNVGGLVDLNNPHRPREAYIPFSKANYVLRSTATHVEIASFVGAIHDTLISRSDLYHPDIQRKPVTSSDPKAANNTVAHLKQDAYFSTSTIDTPPATPRDRYSTAPQSPARPPSSSTTTPTSPRSAVPSITKSEDQAVRGVLLSSSSQMDGLAGKTGTSPSVSGVNRRRKEGNDDDDSEDSEERRLMPLYLRREANRGDGKKALKWLGLE